MIDLSDAHIYGGLLLLALGLGLFHIGIGIVVLGAGLVALGAWYALAAARAADTDEVTDESD